MRGRTTPALAFCFDTAVLTWCGGNVCWGPPQAKELRPVADNMITLAKDVSGTVSGASHKSSVPCTR